MLVALAALLLGHVASPPPPPNPAPAVAQGEFDGYAGRELWDAWLSWVRVRAIEQRTAAFDALGAPEGWWVYRDGPSFEQDSGRWTEYSQAGYVYACRRDDGSCEWIFRSAGLQRDQQVYADLAESRFDGTALAAELRAGGILPSALAGHAGFRFESGAQIDDLIEPLLRLRQVRETDCPAVGQWQAPLAEMPPLPLNGERADARGPQTPPIPIHIRYTLDIPMTAFGGADVHVRIDDVRNAQLWTLWQTITAGIEACED